MKGRTALILKFLVLGWALSTAEQAPQAENGPKLEQIIPKGTWEKASVPETLDLAERAELAIQGITWNLSPKYDYEEKIPAFEMGGFAVLTPKCTEALPYLRVMTGSGFNADVEKNMMSSILKKIGPHGLFYVPIDQPWRAGARSDKYEKPKEPYANVYGNARLALAMMAWHERDHDPAWVDKIRDMVEGLASIAVDQGDYAYYPDGRVGMEFSYLQKTGWKNKEEAKSDAEGAEGMVMGYQANQVRAMAEYSMMTGDKQILERAGKVVQYMLNPMFWKKGSLQPVSTADVAQWTGHHHGHLVVFRALLAYAAATGDARLKEFVRAGYERGRNLGISRIGCFGMGTEGCSEADMIALAIRMSDLGLGDYWDDADGYIRNLFVEMQHVNPEILNKALGKESIFTDANSAKDRPLKEVIGTFNGNGGPTQLGMVKSIGFIAQDKPVIYCAACCTGNCALALYNAWEAIIRCKDGAAQVNLLLNRVSPWLNVESYLPYEGKVVIKNKTARRIAVCMPGWVKLKEVGCQRNSKKMTPTWLDRQIVIDQVKENDVITIEFPMVEQTVKYVMGIDGSEYQCHMKGNTLIDISPRVKDSMYPIFQREEYKKNKAPMKEVNRFVAASVLQWY